MAFEDLKDQVGERAQQVWARLQENSTFIQLSERYQSLPQSGQRIVAAGGAVLVALLLFMIPWSWYSSSSDKVSEFETNKDLIIDMFKAKRDSGELALAPPRIEPGELITKIQSQLPTVRVSPEQVKSVNQYDNKASGKPTAGIPANVTQQGAAVTLSKLNLTQIVDVGYFLQTVSPGVKIVGMDITAASDDPRYFDVTYKLVSFSIPDPPSKAPAKGDPKKSRADSNAGDEG